MALATGRSSNRLLRENGSFWLPVVRSGGVGASPVCAHKYKHKKYKYNRSDGGTGGLCARSRFWQMIIRGRGGWTNLVGPGPLNGPTWLASSKPTEVEAERAHENGPGWKTEKISQRCLLISSPSVYGSIFKYLSSSPHQQFAAFNLSSTWIASHAFNRRSTLLWTAASTRYPSPKSTIAVFYSTIFHCLTSI